MRIEKVLFHPLTPEDIRSILWDLTDHFSFFMQSQAYRYLSAVLAAGSISKAAQTLGISQPSLS